MRIPCALSVVLVLTVAGSASAQEKPDFSGAWVLTTRTAVPANVPVMIVVRQSFRRESVSGVPLPSPIVSMHVERRGADGDVTPDDFTIGIIGGVVGGPAGGVSIRRNFAATWDGDRLVLETTWSGRPVDAGTSSLHWERWAIDGSGLLAVTTKESVGLAHFTTTTVSYRRQP